MLQLALVWQRAAILKDELVESVHYGKRTREPIQHNCENYLFENVYDITSQLELRVLALTYLGPCLGARLWGAHLP